MPALTKFEEYLQRAFTVSAEDEACNCYTDTSSGNDYCAISMHCCELQGCSWQWWGCGISQLYPCNGLCYLNH